MKAYDGPELPRHQIAIISYRYNWVPWRGQVYVEAVDGKQTKLPWSGNVAVKPGQHKVQIHVGYSNPLWIGGTNVAVLSSRGASMVLQFEAEAGHTYVVRETNTYFPNKEWVWIQNLATWKVVAGERPE